MNAAKQCVAAAAAAAGVVVLAVLAMGSCGCDHEMVGAGAAPPPPPDAAPPLARTYDYTQKVSVSAKRDKGVRNLFLLDFGRARGRFGACQGSPDPQPAEWSVTC